MQTILGSGGSIGKHLAKYLNEYTDNIRLVSRNPKKINHNDEILAFDLTKSEAIDRAINGSEIVYVTIAFEYNYKIWSDNWVPFIKNVVDACIKYKAKLVFFDNIYMYDQNYLSNMTENTPINPPSKKGKIRKEVADVILNAIETNNLNALIARSPDFIGERNSILVEVVYNNLIKGKKPVWLGNPNKIHSFIYTKDAAKATAMLGNTPDAYKQIWHLPCVQTNYTGKDWIELFTSELGKKPNFSTIPTSLFGLLSIFIKPMKELREMSYQLNRDYFFNCQKFLNKFDFEITEPRIAVKEIIKNLKTLK